MARSKKGGRALVEFSNLTEAQMAAKIETGFPGNKLSIKPLWEEETATGNPGVAKASNGKSDVIDLTGPQGCQGALSNDFESLVMRNMRQVGSDAMKSIFVNSFSPTQAEERTQLIAQMLAEEKDAS